jgi:hypothetical protein
VIIIGGIVSSPVTGGAPLFLGWCWRVFKVTAFSGYLAFG